MIMDPHMKALADLLVGIAVRELQTARSGNEKARTDGNRIRAKGINDEQYKPIRREAACGHKLL